MGWGQSGSLLVPCSERESNWSIWRKRLKTRMCAGSVQRLGGVERGPFPAFSLLAGAAARDGFALDWPHRHSLAVFSSHRASRHELVKRCLNAIGSSRFDMFVASGIERGMTKAHDR
jgi:hypothetical protein